MCDYGITQGSPVVSTGLPIENDALRTLLFLFSIIF